MSKRQSEHINNFNYDLVKREPDQFTDQLNKMVHRMNRDRRSMEVRNGDQAIVMGQLPNGSGFGLASYQVTGDVYVEIVRII